ncbi:MAG: hypothetical protein ABR583_03450 [Gaiellaceae bacterium]
MEPGAGQGDVRLTPALASALLVTPVRVGLGAVGLLASLARGVDGGPALMAFALGALGFAVVALSADRFSIANEDPGPPPPEAAETSRLEALRAALYPSTLGLALLLAIALVASPALAAVLAGVLAGMGAATLLGAAQIYARERADGVRLLVDRRARTIYAERR